MEVETRLRDRNNLKPPVKFKDYVMLLDPDFNEPTTYLEAINSVHRDEWIDAMNDEMDSLHRNNTCQLSELPEGKKPIPCKWVYKVKTNPDGSIDKFKARLVIKGFSQKQGIDFKETFSPVVRLGTIRTMISVAASEGMSLAQFDVSTAFLYGDLDEELYMLQPEGYDDGSGRVCRLMRSLYGLKQAPRCWNRRISDYLLKVGFKRSQADPCFFVRDNGSEKLLLALYVDDGLLAASNDALVSQFLEELKAEFKITVKLPAKYFLGLEIERRDDGSIKLHQRSYTEKILEKYGMDKCKPVSTPILGAGYPNDDVQEDAEGFPYRQAVGALMYLSTGTRPDISYAVGVVSRSLENPSKSDCVKVKRIFRYLRGTTDYGILYKYNHKQGELDNYSDADHGGDATTGRSTSGVVCIYAGGAISWLSQRQPSVAISTTEAEVVAASEAAREIVWLKELFQDITYINNPPKLHVDNEATIKLAQNPEYHRRTKHIRRRHFFVRELVLQGNLEVCKICTEFQIADIMTKPLHKPRLLALAHELGLCN